jgi:hypothetical protein
VVKLADHTFASIMINMVLKDGVVVDRKSLPAVHAVDFYDPEAAWPF